MKHSLKNMLYVLTAMCGIYFAPAHAAEPQKCNMPKEGDVYQLGQIYWVGDCSSDLANGKGMLLKFEFTDDEHIPKANLNGKADTIHIKVQIGEMASGKKNGQWIDLKAPDYTKFFFNQVWQMDARLNYNNGMLTKMDRSGYPNSFKLPSEAADIEKFIKKTLKEATFSKEWQLSNRNNGLQNTRIVDVVNAKVKLKTSMTSYQKDFYERPDLISLNNSIAYWTGGLTESDTVPGIIKTFNDTGIYFESLDGKKISYVERCSSPSSVWGLCNDSDTELYFVTDNNQIIKVLTKYPKGIVMGDSQVSLYQSNTYSIIQPNELPDWAKDLGKSIAQATNPELVAVLKANNITPSATVETKQNRQPNQANSQDSNAVLVKAGKCQLYANTAPVGKVDWKGACVKGFANGEGITRYYNADKKLFAIGKDTYQNGQYQGTKDAYFISEGAIMQMAKDPNQPAQSVTKEDLPVWAADIAKGASKQSNDTKPAVSGQAGVSF